MVYGIDMSKKEVKINTIADLEKEIEKKFNTLVYTRSRSNAWGDFIKLLAITLHNQLTPTNYNPEFKKELEDDYLRTIKPYSKSEITTLTELCGLVLLTPKYSLPFDLLGKLYMKLEVSNSHLGQFFTPDSISNLMAKMIGGENNNGIKEKIKTTEYDITIHDPACGSSSTLIASVADNIESKDRIVLYGVDIDITAIYMSYIHCTIWDIRGVYVHGNSLTQEEHSKWVTPHYFRITPNPSPDNTGLDEEAVA